MGILVDIQREEGVTIRTKADQERHKSEDKSKDIDGFLDLVAEAWEDYQNRYGVPTNQWVPVKYTRPKETVESPDAPSTVILFKLKSRKKGNMTPDGERLQQTPSYREEIPDPNDDENTITLLGLKRDNWVEFEIWSTHSKKANQIAIDFEGFMQAYDWYFTSKGINRVWFDERKEDTVVETGGTEWSVRTLQYLVITELIYKQVDKKLKLITVRHDTGSKLKTETINATTGLLEHSIDRGTSE